LQSENYQSMTKRLQSLRELLLPDASRRCAETILSLNAKP
jgi:hypothetical protein